jgi:hypothetical protein
VGNDAVIPYGNHFTHKGMRLDFAAIPYQDILLNFYKGSDKAIIPYLAAVNVCRLNDGYVLSEFYIKDLSLHDFWLIHDHLIIVNTSSHYHESRIPAYAGMTMN